MVSFRDCFPSDLVEHARILTQEGAGLKRERKVAAFRVAAQGPACIPVLHTKDTGGRWTVHNKTNRSSSR